MRAGRIFASVALLLNQAVSGLAAQPIPMDRVPGLIRVPRIDQGTDYTCGVAALQSLLLHYDEENDFLEEDLARELRANRRDGTRTRAIERIARSLGYSVMTETPMSLSSLLKYLDSGQPVLVLLQAWRTELRPWEDLWQDGHFAVAIGYDAERIYFMDPSLSARYGYIPIPEFVSRWHDFDGRSRVYQLGMVIHKGLATFRDDWILPIE